MPAVGVPPTATPRAASSWVSSRAAASAGSAARSGSPVTRASLTSRASYGPGLDAADVVDPARGEELVVVAAAVADDGALDALHAGRDDGVGEGVERRRVGDRVGVVLHRIRRAGQQRVAAADEVEVAGDRPAARRRAPAPRS